LEERRGKLTRGDKMGVEKGGKRGKMDERVGKEREREGGEG